LVLLLITLALLPLWYFGLFGVWAGGILVSWFVLGWFYGGIFEAYWNGQTPGKRIMKIRVLSVDGQPINGLQAVLRNILRAVDSQPFLTYFVGLVVASANGRFQRLGDWVCGTMVVIEERSWFHGVIHTSEDGVRELADKIPAGFQVSPTLARALASYVQRRAYFSPPRRMEISRYVGEPLRNRFGLPMDTNLDHLLQALYHRSFITDGIVDEPDCQRRPRELNGSPFQQPEAASPFAPPTSPTVPPITASAGAAIVPPIRLADDPLPEADHEPVASEIGGAQVDLDRPTEESPQPGDQGPSKEEADR
jgi:hypothetical protein